MHPASRRIDLGILHNAMFDSSWISFFRCPKCGGHFRVFAPGTPALLDPSLTCTSCLQSYPVRESIPVLLAETTQSEEKTEALYGDIWQSYGGKKRLPARGYEAPATSNLELLRLASGAELMQGEIGVDAGCGNGHASMALAQAHPGTRLIGIDLSPGVFRHADRAAHIPNLCLARGNLLTLPLAERSFDFVFSFGVLHHTRDPFSAFSRLVEILRPGGRITLFVYKDFSDMPIKRALLLPVKTLRRLTTKMPAPVLRRLAWIGAPLVFLALTLPARLLRRLGMNRLARHIPYGIFPHVTGIASSLQDRFGAPYEHRFSLRDLEKWAGAAGLVDARVVDCIPWGFSGLVLSGRVPGVKP